MHISHLPMFITSIKETSDRQSNIYVPLIKADPFHDRLIPFYRGKITELCFHSSAHHNPDHQTNAWHPLLTKAALSW